MTAELDEELGRRTTGDPGTEVYVEVIGGGTASTFRAGCRRPGLPAEGRVDG